MKETTPDHSFTLYPNPAKDILNVRFDKMITQPFLAEIINAEGQKVLTVNMDRVQDSYTINISQLQHGIYSIKITSEREFVTRKFIIGK